MVSAQQHDSVTLITKSQREQESYLGIHLLSTHRIHPFMKLGREVRGWRRKIRRSEEEEAEKRWWRGGRRMLK
jgi:hypothetical protein